jgi:glycosyltransferase involved in cell wall biosynthesis
MDNNSANKKMSVVFLSRWLGFPHGMASTQRIRLMARALVGDGVNVTVLSVGPSERPPVVENLESKGIYQGINFEYTSGDTIRSESFFGRRWQAIKGLIKAIFKLIGMRKDGSLDCLYLYDTAHKINIIHFVFVPLANLLGVPAVIELNELPWSFQNTSFLNKHHSPISGVGGVVVISEYLSRWVAQEARKKNRKLPVIKIPILANVAEQEPVKDDSTRDPILVFAGSPHYEETIRFVLDAISIVIKKHPTCKLIITGYNPEDPGSKWLGDEIQQRSMSNSVKLPGYLSRTNLLQKYADSRALLIPLFDDPRSAARFPTKIGEYLASGRPVITTKVGEANYYLTDGENALMCDPNNVYDYAEKIVEALEHTHRSEEIGRRGRLLALQKFHYEIYGGALKNFLASLTGNTDRRCEKQYKRAREN